MNMDKTPAGLRRVELVGGPRDGEIFAVRTVHEELRVPYAVPTDSFVDNGAEPILPVFRIGRYTWQTEADMLLGRWTWSDQA